MEKAEVFINQFAQWAEKQEEILGSFLVGSWARGTARDDSDVDVVVIVKDPSMFLKNTEWVKNFGTVKEIKQEDYNLVQAIRVFYENGLEVEFDITTSAWLAVPLDSDTARVLKDGYKVLNDKAGLFSEVSKAILSQ